MNKAMKDHILKGLAKGIRRDGRKLTEFRNVTVEPNFARSAEGSARVTIGSTVVIAGVKMGVEKPYPDTPERGNLMVNAELTPMSSPEFEPGPPGNQANELARVVDRGIRESKAVVPENLCITPAEKVWSVMIDVVSVNDNGNLMDASGLAALAALRSTKYPTFDGTSVDYQKKTDKSLELGAEPLPVTIIKAGDHIVVDPLPEEEEIADARLTIATLADGSISAKSNSMLGLLWPAVEQEHLPGLMAAAADLDGQASSRPDRPIPQIQRRFDAQWRSDGG